MKQIFFIIIMVLAWNINHAQQQKKLQFGKFKQVIAVNGKPYSDHIKLRWNIADYRMFQSLCLNGVHIERIVINKQNKAESNWQRLTKKPIKALPLESFLSNNLKSDSFCLSVAQCLYGKTNFPTNVSLVEQIQNNQYDLQNRQAIATVSAVMSQKAAFAAGLAFNDSIKVEEGKKYVYRLFMDTLFEDKKFDTGYVYVITNGLGYTESVKYIYAQSKDKAITLNWPKDQNFFSGYFIERSTDNINFTRITKRPYLPYIDSNSKVLTYTDSVQNYQTFYYKIIGLNEFGEQLPSTEIVSANAIDLTPPVSPLLQVKYLTKSIELKWNKSIDKDFKGYYLLFGNKSNQTDSLVSKEMLKSNITIYNFDLPINFKSKYFRLLLVDTNGNYSLSNSVYVFKADTTPPSPPIISSGSIDSFGTVILKWKAIRNDEILGYKVFFANQKDHSFAPITDLIDQDSFSYKINLNTLSTVIYYRVLAVDQNYNHSKFSEIFAITKPDIVPPPEPVIEGYKLQNNTITFNWSKITLEDFDYFEIYKKTSTDSLWKLFKATPSNTDSDSSLVENTLYEYAIKSVDKHGLISRLSFPISVKTGFFEKTENPNIQTNIINDSNILVTWTPSNYAIKQTWIYLNTKTSYKLYQVLEGNKGEFLDTINLKNPNKYAIRFIYKNGGESTLLLQK